MSVLLDPVQSPETAALDALMPHLVYAAFSSRCASRSPGYLCATGLRLGALSQLPRCTLGHPQIPTLCLLGATPTGGVR